MKRFWIRRSDDWLDIYFDSVSKLRIQSTANYLLWISYGWRAEIQFTINRWWLWPKETLLSRIKRERRIELLLFSLTWS